ncbi:hypothetical protein [Aureimonas sp. N4]|uniref:hypothetical protein n=1 Tax=Aureimonas sp. N4 TaxID=1638165 RepID=UPI000783A1EA|nr:hypothetical protein [Aureimonas sp. N4]
MTRRKIDASNMTELRTIACDAMKRMMERLRALPEDEFQAVKAINEADREALPGPLAEVDFIAGAIDAVERGRQGDAA